jgi:hypothetical protein
MPDQPRDLPFFCVVQEHASRHCPGAVCFSVEQLVPGEPAALLATCSTCQLLEVVV